MKTALVEALDRDTLRRLAGARAFARGEDYFRSGQVLLVESDEEAVTESVRGTSDYRVELSRSAGAGELAYSCACPVGAEGTFCKHCVALGLAFVGSGGPDGSRTATMKDVRAHLERQDKQTLVGLLLEWAKEDEMLRRRLLLEAARVGWRNLALATLRQAIDRAVVVHGFVDYRSMWDYAQGIEDVIDALEGVLEAGRASEVVDLTEYFIAAVEEHMGAADDSAGRMGGILERLRALHHRACVSAKPDPEALAERLFAWGIHGEYESFLGAADEYADVLGESGLARYRELAEAEWPRVRPLGPGQSDPDGFGRRFRITRVMEALARHGGGLEALVAVKSRDLSGAYDFLQITEAYRQAGDADRALEWAEQGVRAFPERTDSRAARIRRRGV